MAKQARPHSWRGPKTTVIPMHASCPSAECSALLKPSVGGRRTRTPSASATRARSTKKKYTVSASIYVAIVNKQAHGARRRYAPIPFAHDRKIFASIFTPRKMRRKLLRRRLLRCRLLFSFPDFFCVHTVQQLESVSVGVRVDLRLGPE